MEKLSNDHNDVLEILGDINETLEKDIMVNSSIFKKHFTLWIIATS